ncbi:hypothetical protein SDC9_167173 [bioreactor metagenome]|uniref:Uncharacterized protein n=1 Tax=bioreactor metagenome TaxID=1076179 RepID=A0A645FZ30_9ZZZZ
MTGEMRDLGQVSQGQFDLSPKLLLYFGQVPLMFRDTLAGIIGVFTYLRKEVAVFIHQRGTGSQRTPFDQIPFAGERQMQSNRNFRVCPQNANGFREPRADRHDFNGGGDSFLTCFETGNVAGSGRAHVIGADDQARRLRIGG